MQSSIKEIDKIVFGNPSARDYKIMQEQNYLDRLIPDFKMFPPPKNSSETTKKELQSLTDFVNTKREIQHHLFDEQLIAYIKKIFVDAGADQENIDMTAHNIMIDVVPLITKLKYFFNRPRPSQLACYYGLHLFPDFSYFTNTPSFPSGHSTLTAITCEVLGNHYPESYSRMKELIESVSVSRLYIGAHYPSDNDMSMVVAKRVISNPEFKLRHRL